jgi:hypothetical protein
MNEHVNNEQMAEAQGWRFDKVNNTYYELLGAGMRNEYGRPDYTHDLNLVREIENTLTDAEWDAYIMRGVLPDGKRKILNITPTEYLDNLRLVCSATAQQKCDAIFPILQARHAA